VCNFYTKVGGENGIARKIEKIFFYERVFESGINKNSLSVSG
jgi:hypothetical protein